jgi:broad specificity phosphatase PhoE
VIWLVRHGQTEINRVGRFQGRLDSPLTELGETQARRVGARLRALAAEVGGAWAIDASPLGRTRRTAALISDGMGLAVRRHDARLAEVDFGPWEGLTRDQIVALRPDLAEAKTFFLRCPEGESSRRSAGGCAPGWTKPTPTPSTGSPSPTPASAA